MVIWVIKNWSYSSSVYHCHLILTSPAFVRSLQFLFFIVSIFAWNIPLVSPIFLRKISSLSYSIVFLCFFELFTWKGFLISPSYSLELCLQLRISLPFDFDFCFSSFLSYFNPSLDNCFVFLQLLDMVLVTTSCTVVWTSVHSSSGILSVLIPWINLSPPLYNLKGFDLVHTWWPSGFPYFVQFEPEFCNTELNKEVNFTIMIWATVGSSSYFCWLY